jgi:membrane-associated protease RseP (regulator of RpoE activity)
MKRLAFTAVLFTAVAAVVGTLAAQDAREPREPGDRARVFSFAFPGSQLGVTISDLEAGDLGGVVTGGIRITEVHPDSPAARAGLQAGDIVAVFDGERVRSSRQFQRLVQETPDGRTVDMEIVRDGRRQALQVTPERQTWRGDGDWPRTMTWRFEDLEPRLRELEPRLRELEPRLREMEPMLRERLRELEPRLREHEPEIRQRLEEIERMLRQLLERQEGR